MDSVAAQIAIAYISNETAHEMRNRPFIWIFMWVEYFMFFEVCTSQTNWMFFLTKTILVII